MDTIGAPELILIIVIVLILFGPGRIGKIAGELGSGIRAFREGLTGKEEEKKQVSNLATEVSNPPAVAEEVEVISDKGRIPHAK